MQRPFPPPSPLFPPVCSTYRETKIDCTLWTGESQPNDESTQYITGDHLPTSNGWLTVQNLVTAVLSNEPPIISAEMPRTQRGDYHTIILINLSQ